MPTRPEDEAVKLLERRARGLKAMKTLIPASAECHDEACAALEEASAILSDAAEVCRHGTLKQRAAQIEAEV